MKTKPTLYIIDKYKDGTNDLEETISFPIYETSQLPTTEIDFSRGL